MAGRDKRPSLGYMRLIKERLVDAWGSLRDDVHTRAAEIEGRLKTIQQKLDRLDEAFLYERSIDIDTYDRQKDRLREEQTLAQIDRQLKALRKVWWRGCVAFRGSTSSTATARCRTISS